MVIFISPSPFFYSFMPSKTIQDPDPLKRKRSDQHLLE